MSTSTSGGASFFLQPPQFIMTQQNINILAVVKYGPLPPSLTPTNLQAFLCLGDPSTNEAIKDRSVYPAQTGQHIAVTGVGLPGEGEYAFFLFHNATFPKAGTYKLGISIQEDIIDAINMAQIWSSAFTVGSVAGDMTLTPDEQTIIDKLKKAKVFGAN